MAVDDLAARSFTNKIVTRFAPFQGVERLLNFALRGNRGDPHGDTMIKISENVIPRLHDQIVLLLAHGVCSILDTLVVAMLDVVRAAQHTVIRI